METKDKEENTLTIETYISWKNKRFALKDFIKETLKEIEDNKKRIDKAIEYTEERKHLNWYADGVFVDELLNILRGEDENDSI